MDINGIYLNASQPTQSVHNIRSIFKLWTVCFHSIYSIPLISVPGNKAPGSSLGFTPTPNHPEIKTGLCASVITNYENVRKCMKMSFSRATKNISNWDDVVPSSPNLPQIPSVKLEHTDVFYDLGLPRSGDLAPTVATSFQPACSEQCPSGWHWA